MKPEEIQQKYAHRNAAVVNLLQFFTDVHFQSQIQELVQSLHLAAFEMADCLCDGPQLVDGLKQLLRARDSFMRQYWSDNNFYTGPQRSPNKNLSSDVPPKAPGLYIDPKLL